MTDPMSEETLHGMEQNAVQTRDKQRLRLIAEVRRCWDHAAKLDAYVDDLEREITQLRRERDHANWVADAAEKKIRWLSQMEPEDVCKQGEAERQ